MKESLRQSYDVIVVGTGPAGATLAYELSSQGIAVLLLDKEKLPRYKTCAGGLTIKAAKLLSFDISPVVESTINGLRFSYKFGHQGTRLCDRPLIYTVMREKFDYFLVEKARDAGAEDTPHRLDQSLVVLKIDPVLSPLSGTAIKDLEFGDEIQVRITDERDIAGYLADLLGAKVDDLRVPVMTKIVEVRELEGGNLGVITQFGPGIVGMFRVLEDTKIVTKGEAAEEPEQVQKSGGQFNPMILVAGAFVLVIIFILLIVMTR